jgi:hypothetical protein
MGLLQMKKLIDRRWAAGVMMAVTVATRDYFASCDQPRLVVSLVHVPVSIIYLCLYLLLSRRINAARP